MEGSRHAPGLLPPVSFAGWRRTLAALAAAVAARPPVIVIAGPAGSGKRLLLAAFEDGDADGVEADSPPWQWRAFKAAQAFKGARVIVVRPEALEPLLGFHPVAQVVWMQAMDDADVHEMVLGRMRQHGMTADRIGADALTRLQQGAAGSPRRVDAIFGRAREIARDNLSDGIEAWHVEEARREVEADLQDRNALDEDDGRPSPVDPDEGAVVDAFSLFGEASGRAELERSNARWRRARIRDRVLLWTGVMGLAAALVAVVVVALPGLGGGGGRWGAGPAGARKGLRAGAAALALAAPPAPVREAPGPLAAVAVGKPDLGAGRPADAPAIDPAPGGLAQAAGSAGAPDSARRVADVEVAQAPEPAPPVELASAATPPAAGTALDDGADQHLPGEIRAQAARLVELARTLVRRGQMSEAEAIYATAARMGNADAVVAMNILRPLAGGWQPDATVVDSRNAGPGGTAAAN